MSWLKDLLNPINWSNPWKAKHWGIDISFWNTVSLAQLQDMKSHGLDLIWIQMCNGVTEDSKFRTNTAAARAAGVPFGVYAWLDPTLDPIQQASVGISLFNNYAYDAKNYFIDIEQRNRSQIDPTTPALTSTQIYNAFNTYFTWIYPKLNVPLGTYSGPDYLNNVCPALKPWCKQYFYVNASYGTNASGIVSWPQFTNILSAIHACIVPSGLAQSDVDSMQWNSAMHIQNDAGKVYENLDYDGFQSDDVYSRLFGLPVVPPPTIVGTQKSIVKCLYVTLRSRADPNSTNLGYLMVSDKVFVNSTGYAPNGQLWANITFGGCAPRWPLLSQKITGWVNAYYIG